MKTILVKGFHSAEQELKRRGITAKFHHATWSGETLWETEADMSVLNSWFLESGDKFPCPEGSLMLISHYMPALY